MDPNHIWDLGYDVVVALTQDAINGQLLLMSDPDVGSINTYVIVSFEPSQPGGGPPQPSDYIPHFYSDFTDVPKVTNSQGQTVPQYETVNGVFQPSLTIGPNNPPNDDGSPQKVALLMTWQTGTMYSGDQTHSWDMTGWTWSAAVDLQVSILDLGSLVEGIAAPVPAFTELQKLTVAGATSFCLMLEFVAGGAWDCRTGPITDPAASVCNQDAMIPYFSYLVINPNSNPYIFTYNIAGNGIPPSLTTVGCTFSLFQDAQTPGHSTVNFIFNTQTSPPGPVAGVNQYPGTFATNWIAASDQCDGKVVYSRRCFLEDIIMQPIKQAVGASGPMGQREPGFGYTLYSWTDGNPRIREDAEGAYGDVSGTNMIALSGAHELFTEVDSRVVWSWSANSSLSSGLDSNDDPVLIVGAPVMAGSGGPYRNAQSCLNSFSTSPPGIYAQKQIMLPFGNYFFAKDMVFQTDGTFSTQVTFKSPTGGGNGEGLNGGVPPGMYVVEYNIGKVIAIRPGALSVAKKIATVKTAKSAQSVTDDQSALGKPMQDQVSLALLHPTTAVQQVDISVSCELMKNAKIAMPITASSTMIAAQDATGHPLVCSIGSDRSLNILVANTGQNDSGWATTNVLQSFEGIAEASVFDLVQELSGQWSLGFVGQGQGTSTVFFASLLSNDLSNTDLTNLASSSLTVEGIDPAFTAESIKIGNSQDGARPLLTVEGSLSGKHLLYQLGPEDTQAVLVELPQDVSPGGQNLLGHRTGVMYGYASNYFLYNVGQVQQLVALARDQSSSPTQETFDWDFSDVIKGAVCHCIATCPIPDTPRFSDLYVGGAAGVSRVPDGQVKLTELVADPKVVGEVMELSVAYDALQVAVWALNTNNDLYYVRGVRTPSSKVIAWSVPILFSRKITRVAPMRSFLRQTNELFMLNHDDVLSHYWQDPTSTVWRKRTGNEQAKATVVDYDSYTTHLHFEEGGIAVSNGMTVTVTSSEWQYLTINNTVYTVDDKTPAKVNADAMGNITLICDANDTAPPVLHVTSPQFAETLNIYPNGKVHKLLSNVTDGNSLNSAKDQAGKLVVPSSVDSGTTDGIATRVQECHKTGDTEYPPVTAGNTFLVVENPASPSARGLKHTLMAPIKLSKPKKRYLGGAKPLAAMTFANGKWRPMTESEAQALRSTAAVQPLFDIGDFFGDIWHGIESVADDLLTSIEDAVVTVEEGVSFVLQQAEDGLSLVLNYFGKVLTFALDVFVQVFKAISALLKLIGIDISAILRWLGHLFGWDTIWDTHKLIAQTITNFLQFGVDSTEKYLDKARSEAKDAFTGLEQRLQDLRSSGSATLSLQNAAPVSPAQTLTNSPQGNYAFYHFHNALSGAGTVGSASTLKSHSSGKALQSSGDFGNIFERIILQILSDIVPKLGTDIGDLVSVLKSGNISDALNFFIDLLTSFLDTVEDAVDILLATFGQVIGGLQSILDGDFGMPILAALYEFVTELLGNEESFTIINGFSFIAAVATVATLDVYGEAQLPDRNIMDCTNPDFPSRLEQSMIAKAGLKSSNGLRTPSGFLQQSSPQPNEASEDWSLLAGVMLNISNVMSGIASAIPGELDSDVAKATFALSMACTVFGFPVPSGEGQPLDTWIQRIASWAASSAVNVLTSIPQGANGTVDALFAGRSKPPAQVQGAVNLIMGVLVLALAIEIDIREGADVLTWMSDMCGNLGGIGLSVGQFTDNVEVKVASVGFSFFGATFAFGELIEAEQAAPKRVFKRCLGPCS